MGQSASIPSTESSAETLDEEQPKDPVIYLLGRSGHGKSSLVNALANKMVAQISHVFTITSSAEKWNVATTDGIPYTLVESHDLFEQHSNGHDSFTKKLEKDLTEHKPSAILYVLGCSEVRSAANDFEMISAFCRSRNVVAPVFVVLTKADIFYRAQLWPAEDHTEKQAMLSELLDYTCKDVLSAVSLQPIQEECLYYGYSTKGCEPFHGVVPVANLLNGKDESWNIDKLRFLLTKALSEDEQPYDFQSEVQVMVKEVRNMFEILCKKYNIVGATYEIFRQTALQPTVEMLEGLIENARAPVVYLMGRSGHGKSSLINALTNNDQAEIGHITPTTSESVEYDITFKGQNTSWKIVESRGIFESTTAAGAPRMSATEQVGKDLENYKPDIILHVITCSKARNLAADLKFVRKMFKTMKSDFGETPPVIVVLTKADAFYHPTLWPIEERADKQKALERLLDYILSSGTREFLDSTAKYYGCHLKGCEPYLYVVPVATLMIEPPVLWNTDRLNELIGKKLPLEAWLHFYNSQKRQKNMKELALKVVDKMATISTGIGFIIHGVGGVFLMPLYVIMVSLIAKLSGRALSSTTAVEFLKTCKFWQGAAIVGGAVLTAGFLAAAEVIELVLFGVGCEISAPVIASATYSVGRAAIAYYFDNEIKTPESYKMEWTPP